MGDEYRSQGQVGAMGRGARAEGNTFQQINVGALEGLELGRLAEELGRLRAELRQTATETAQDRAVLAIGEAEEAARAGGRFEQG